MNKPRQVEVVITDPSLELDVASVVGCLHALDEIDGFDAPRGSIEIAFIDEATCSRLHNDFFGDPDPTDVMTFPGDPCDEHAGDIAVCPSVANQRSREEGTTFAEELTLYVVHAWLHLAGLDDKEELAIRRMRAAEKQAMAHLRGKSRLLRASWLN